MVQLRSLTGHQTEIEMKPDLIIHMYKYIPAFWDSLTSSEGSRTSAKAIEDAKLAVRSALPRECTLLEGGASNGYCNLGISISLPANLENMEDEDCVKECVTMMDGTVNEVVVRSCDLPITCVGSCWISFDDDVLLSYTTEEIELMGAEHHAFYYWDAECEYALESSGENVRENEPCYVLDGVFFTEGTRFTVFWRRL